MGYWFGVSFDTQYVLCLVSKYCLILNIMQGRVTLFENLTLYVTTKIATFS